MSWVNTGIDILGKVASADYVKLAQPFANELAKRIINPNTSKEDKKLYQDLQNLIAHYQDLSSKLKDSEFIRKRNLSLWLYNKFTQEDDFNDKKYYYHTFLKRLIYKSDNGFHIFDSYSDIPNNNENYKGLKKNIQKIYFLFLKRYFLTI